MGPLGEDVQDQHRAIDDLDVHLVGNRADLRRVQFLVEDDHGRTAVECRQGQLFHLPAAHQEARVDLLAVLEKGIDRFYVAGGRQLSELGQRVACLPARGAGDADQQGALFPACGVMKRAHLGEFVLESPDQIEAIDIQRVGRKGWQQLPGGLGRCPGKNVGQIDSGEFGFDDCRDDPHQVEPEQGQIGQVVLGRRLIV